MVGSLMARLVVASVAVAATSVGVLAAPASAATCSSADGVSVVVDFNGLGGGVQTGCVLGGGGKVASSLFPAAGFSLAYVQRQQGFVCRIDGRPASDPCVDTPPADAYWGLWWSDGRTGAWSYATTGVGSLKVPDGGYVAFSWNGSDARSEPSADPAPHAESAPPASGPAPNAAPSHQGSGSAASHSPSPDGSASGPPSPGPAGPETVSADSSGSSADPSASSTTKGSRKAHAQHKRHGKPDAETTERAASGGSDPPSEAGAVETATSASSEAVDPDGGGLPTWVAPVVIVVLFAAAGAVAVVRRRRGTPAP